MYEVFGIFLLCKFNQLSGISNNTSSFSFRFGIFTADSTHFCDRKLKSREYVIDHMNKRVHICLYFS